ncbi:hypothetical protein GF324_10615 [bacterium]|nr:hypothetical protein [bacterium]
MPTGITVQICARSVQTAKVLDAAGRDTPDFRGFWRLMVAEYVLPPINMLTGGSFDVP